MKILALTGILFLISLQSKADVIYSPITNMGLAVSLEGIGSYEIPFTKYNTINFWGGFGVVSPVDRLFHPAVGGEVALELRQYFAGEKFRKFNLGLYSGFAVMRYPYFYNDRVSGYERSIGFVPGIKLTYKHRFNSYLVGEPYVGISMPWYAGESEKLSEVLKDGNPGLMVTVGLRIGFNKVFKRE
ncbi:MAG: hypothetical protein JXJ22_07345 [Bacteroidales bacterium]|nr:hypothetical protein [Bacteroidales bacterium]